MRPSQSSESLPPEGEIRPTTASQTTFFAVLIGIDNYPQRPLVSCVRDVRGIRKFLVERANSNKSKLCLTTLTSCGSDPRGASQLDKDTATGHDAEQAATYNGIVEALQKTARAVKAGDVVYIHFSGHGTHLPPRRVLDSSRHQTGDTGLVVLHDSDDSVHYLRGWHLAKLVQDILGDEVRDQRAQVTLVLDCCVSGSVLRCGTEHDMADARYLPYDEQVDGEFPHLDTELASAEVLQTSSGTDMRAGTSLPDWIRNPHGYCVLAACGPHEVARNIGGNSLPQFGAFSYCLIEALRSENVNSVRQLFQQAMILSTQLQSKYQPFPKQNPTWFGNVDIQLFEMGMTRNDSPNFLVVQHNTEGDISFRLEGGWAHGIRVGDTFDISSRYRAGQVTIAWAIHVGGVTSILQLENQDNVKRGEVLFATSTRQHFFNDHGTTVSTSSLSIDQLREWKQLQQARPWLHLENEDPTHNAKAKFWVASSPSHIGHDVRLDDATGTVVGTELDASTTLKLVRQATMWQVLRGLRNDSQDLLSETQYNVQFRSLDNPRVTFPTGNVLFVSHNSRLEILVKNLDTQILYIHMYRLGQDWEVENMMRSRYLALYPANFSHQDGRIFDTPYERKSMRPFKIDMTVPEQDPECEDIFKIFITERPTSFDAWTASKFGATEQPWSKSMRTVDESCLPLLNGPDTQNKWTVVDATVKVLRNGLFP